MGWWIRLEAAMFWNAASKLVLKEDVHQKYKTYSDKLPYVLFRVSYDFIENYSLLKIKCLLIQVYNGEQQSK